MVLTELVPAEPGPAPARTGPSPACQPGPVPLLFLIADTGGGHRSAARAVTEALGRRYPGRFAPVLCDPLGGPGSAWPLRVVTGWYGPLIRRAPWLWGAAYHACDSRPAMWLLERTLLRPASSPVMAAAREHRPALVVSFHPLTGPAAIAARDRLVPGAPVVTVVTDLARMHTAWRSAHPDVLVAPAPVVTDGQSRRRGGGPLMMAGDLPRRRGGSLAPAGGGPSRQGDDSVGNGSRSWREGVDPVATGDGQRRLTGGPALAGWPLVSERFTGGPVSQTERERLRRSLGLPAHGFLILLVGGGEGSGGLGRRARAIRRRFPDVGVFVVCGHNGRLRRRLARPAARSGGRLHVTGYTERLPALLRCCDVVVTKAGPGTIAEAACCGTPMLLSSRLPGQEAGNIELVTAAGAGRRARSVRRLLAEIGALRRDPGQLGAMCAASARLARPGAAAEIAELIASLSGTPASDNSKKRSAPGMFSMIGTVLPQDPAAKRS